MNITFHSGKSFEESHREKMKEMREQRIREAEEMVKLVAEYMATEQKDYREI